MNKWIETCALAGNSGESICARDGTRVETCANASPGAPCQCYFSPLPNSRRAPVRQAVEERFRECLTKGCQFPGSPVDDSLCPCAKVAMSLRENDSGIEEAE